MDNTKDKLPDTVLHQQDGDLKGHYIIPEGITEISDFAFYGCGITSIEFPQSLKKIGSHAFAHCSGLTEIVLPFSVSAIGDGAFSECWGLKSIDVGDAYEISENLFECCENLTSVTLPFYMCAIKKEAFWGCSSLKTITIPSSVFEFGSQLFGGNCSIEEIQICNVYPKLIRVDEHAFDFCYEKCKLTVPFDVVEAYQSHPVFGKFNTIVGKRFNDFEVGNCFLIYDEKWNEFNLYGIEKNCADHCLAFEHEVFFNNLNKGFINCDNAYPYYISELKEMTPIPSALIDEYLAVFKKYLDIVADIVERDQTPGPIELKVGNTFKLPGKVFELIEEKDGCWYYKDIAWNEDILCSVFSNDSCYTERKLSKCRPIRHDTYDKVNEILETAAIETIELLKPYVAKKEKC